MLKKSLIVSESETHPGLEVIHHEPSGIHILVIPTDRKDEFITADDVAYMGYKYLSDDSEETYPICFFKVIIEGVDLDNKEIKAHYHTHSFMYLIDYWMQSSGIEGSCSGINNSFIYEAFEPELNY